MAPLITPLLSMLSGRPRRTERCLVCHQTVASADRRVRLPGGGHVHRECSSYSMRARVPQAATD
jgi:hypothetical protein